MPRIQKAHSSTKETVRSDAITLESTESQLPVKALPQLLAPEPVNRIKRKIVLRETDEGVEEVTRNQIYQEPPDTLQKENSRNNPESDALLDAAIGQQSTGLGKESFPSTTSDWNAYAGKSARFEVGAIPDHRLPANEHKLSHEDQETLSAYFEAEIIYDIVALYNRVLHSPNKRFKEHGSVKTAVITDRATRTNVHQDLRRIFQSRLESMTDSDGAMIICAMAAKPQWGSRQPTGNGPSRKPQQNKRPQWQELGGDYLHFTLYKENKDTMEAISWLARQLKLPAKSFQFAGTKDRRGVTVQRVSVYRVLADRMIGAGRTLKQAKIGNYEYQPHELRLGDLIGNEFVITLRDCRFQFVGDYTQEERLSKSDAFIKGLGQQLRENGFINYYGLQRFGTFSTRTDSIGVKMLQGDFKGAVEAILNFSPALLETSQDPKSGFDKVAADNQARAHAIQIFNETGKSHSALESLPKKFSAESSIIRHLSGNNQYNDYQGALNTIPRNLRLMYVHAYQSLVWNVMASLRWRIHGDKVVEGDLVLISEHPDRPGASSKPVETDADGELVVQPEEEDRAINTDDLFERARALSTEEAQSGNYTVFDVVLPTPGYDILYPANDMADHYQTFMASERGGGLDPQNMRRGWKDTSLSGNYRKLLARPMSDIQFELKKYSKDDEQFVQTDLDMMSQGPKHTHSNQRHPRASDCVDKGEAAAPEANVGQKLAVILRLQLGSSQYATMALRELMGPDGLQTYKPDYGGGR